MRFHKMLEIANFDKNSTLMASSQYVSLSFIIFTSMMR